MTEKKSLTVAFTIVSMLSLACLFVNVHGNCNVPPKFWCDSKLTAEKCQVLQQCEENVWSKQYHLKVNKLVNFSVYIESLCPDCKNFIIHQLYPVWKGLSDIMNLTIVPYGNAKEHHQGSKWEFMCQHGEEECTGNIIETCAIHLYKDVKQHFPFIYCLETSSLVPRKSASKCAEQHGLNYNSIMMCANSSLGNLLEHEMAVLTNNLDPPHTYVPWVELNRVHTNHIQEMAERDLKELICMTYYHEFGEKPKVCQWEKVYKCQRK